MEKSSLRRSLLKARESMHPELWRQKSDRLCLHLQHWIESTQAKTILSYFSFRQEPDLNPLLHLPYQWGFPRCVGKALHWHLWSPYGSLPLQTGAYGILEPHPDSPTLEPSQVDLILVPAIACDVRGYRLGYGGGFYDRMLSSPLWSYTPTLGIVFEFARLPRVPVDAWDRSLKGVCTESGLYLSKDLAKRTS